MRLPKTARPIEGHAYLPAIDAFRALAVVAVMVFHLKAESLPGGFAGVDVFFVISGYVVAASMSRDGERPFGDFIASFYARRFRRIAPAMLVCLLATVLASAVFIPDSWLSNALQETGLAAFYGFSNFALVATNDGYFAPRTEFNPFTHTWSLAVEEQFYLIFPLLYYFCIRRSGEFSVYLPYSLLALLCAASFVWCVWASSKSPSSAYYMLPSRFWELGIGAGTYLLGDERRRTLARKFGPDRLLALGLAITASALVLASKEAFPFPWALPATVGTVLMLISTTDGSYRSWWGIVISSSAIVWVGLLSYSLYLWHWPVYTLMRWTIGLESVPMYALAIGVTVMLAWLSYRLIEIPPQKSKMLRQSPALGVIAIGLIALLSGWALASTIFARPWFFKQTVVERDRLDWYSIGRTAGKEFTAGFAAGCTTALDHKSTDVYVIKPIGCELAKWKTPQRVFVLGDSHARRLTRLLDEVVRLTGLEIWTFAKGGCALAPVVWPSSAQSPECRTFLEATTQFLMKEGRAGDVVVLESLRVDRLANAWGQVRSVYVPIESSKIAEQEATELANRLHRAGLTVVFVLPKPVFAAPAYRCADWFNRGNPVCAPGFELPKQQVLEHRRQAVEAINRVVSSIPGSFVWDPLPILCPLDTCRAFDGSRPIYFDADHLSGYGNQILVQDFTAQLGLWLKGKPNP